MTKLQLDPEDKWCPECEDYHPRGWPCVLAEEPTDA
jgi:hypothetical protein